jgi:hypothetical protein
MKLMKVKVKVIGKMKNEKYDLHKCVTDDGTTIE